MELEGFYELDYCYYINIKIWRLNLDTTGRKVTSSTMKLVKR